MNRTIQTLATAAPLTLLALGLGATAAHAEPPAGPGVIVAPPIVDPEVDPEPEPQPEPQPEPTADTDEAASQPEVEPDPPFVPGDKVAVPPPCPTHGPCGDDEPGEGDSSSDDESTPEGDDDFDRPNRIDAGLAADEEPLDLTWLMVGAAVVTATGTAFAVRRSRG